MCSFRLTPVAGDRDNCDFDTEHVLFALSPFNSRYTTRYISELVSWACERFARVDAYIPGYEAAYTLIATGTPVDDAVRRTKRATKQLRNPAIRALREAGVSGAEDHVQTWTQLLGNPAYSARLEEAHHAYEHDQSVREACESTTRAVIESKIDQPANQDQIEGAVSYAICELPLLAASP